MQGHVYRRQKTDGTYTRWRAVIDLPPGPDGKRRQRTTSHDTKRQAQDWLARTNAELQAGEVYDTTITVGQFLTDWLATKKALRPSTRIDYSHHLETIFIPELGRIRLADLRPKQIAAVFDRLAAGNPRRERPIGATTMRKIHATLNSALNAAVAQGLIRRNPARSVELPKTPRTRPTIWTQDQAAAFLCGTREDPLHLLYRVMLLTGLRRGEALGLQWGDLDQDKGTIEISRQIIAVAGQLHVGPPKSDAGHRTLTLDHSTLELLKARHRRAVLAHPWQTDSDLDMSPIFTHPTGRPIHPAHLSAHFTTLTARLDLPRIRLHDLRHTSASLGLEGGESLLSVSRRLGHSSITITADTYTQITPQAARTHAEHLADTLATGHTGQPTVG